MKTPSLHLAQINIARARAPLDDPLMRDFVGQLDTVNLLAESSPGFVWRLKDESGASSSYVHAYADPLVLVNLTVWESIETLRAFTYRTAHVGVLRDRLRWFEPHAAPSFVLWWIEKGHIPLVAEGNTRLEHLRRFGPTPSAFTFGQSFPPTLAPIRETSLGGA